MTTFLSSPLFTVLMVFAGSGTMGAFVVAWSKRGVTKATEAKTKAEAAEILSNSASIRVQEVEKQLGRFWAWYRIHRVWDIDAYQLCRANNLEIRDPPELLDAFYEVM